MNGLYLNAWDYILSQQLFIKVIGIVYFFAFRSLFKQVLGLYGSQGIMPIAQLITSLREERQRKQRLHLYFQFPTIFWWNASDQMLKSITIVGQVLAIPVILGIFPALWLALLWFFYLSFVNVGLDFLSFQWDVLLLEVGFIAIFFAIQSPPPVLLLLALWVLLFRFMFSSGIVKLLSGCPEWKGLKAMTYHYETQPIPNKLAYYMHQQPVWLSKLSEVSMFIIELGVPFLIFGTNGMRLVAFVLLVGFQLLIMLTGNYAFFNILTIALCLVLLNNSALMWMMGIPSLTLQPPLPILSVLLNGVGLFFITLNALQFAFLFVRKRWLYHLLGMFRSYHLINPYGLFACMTTKRYEIVVMGSEDQEHWKIYDFKWKPGNLFRPPSQVAPYHPRLDWQMWFAALGSYQANPWFINFLIRLLEGSKTVEALLESNPFPTKPPKFIRAVIYEYHFTTLQEKKKNKQWWKRSFKGNYTPILALQKQDQTPS